MELFILMLVLLDEGLIGFFFSFKGNAGSLDDLMRIIFGAAILETLGCASSEIGGFVGSKPLSGPDEWEGSMLRGTLLGAFKGRSSTLVEELVASTMDAYSIMGTGDGGLSRTVVLGGSFDLVYKIQSN
jgi:hypothetical protein